MVALPDLTLIHLHQPNTSLYRFGWTRLHQLWTCRPGIAWAWRSTSIFRREWLGCRLFETLLRRWKGPAYNRTRCSRTVRLSLQNFGDLSVQSPVGIQLIRVSYSRQRIEVTIYLSGSIMVLWLVEWESTQCSSSTPPPTPVSELTTCDSHRSTEWLYLQ